jgi:hypothetical protein
LPGVIAWLTQRAGNHLQVGLLLCPEMATPGDWNAYVEWMSAGSR